MLMPKIFIPKVYFSVFHREITTLKSDQHYGHLQNFTLSASAL